MLTFTASAVANTIVDREIRQRTAIKDLDPLMASIERDGLLHPITIHEDGKLVAGERRLEAHKRLGIPMIRAQIFERLKPQDAYRVELNENLARKNLPWQDECRAVLVYHTMKRQVNNGLWTVQGTATDLGVSKSAAQRYLTVAEYLADAEVMGATSIDGALNLIRGRAERATAAAAARGLDIAVAHVAIGKNATPEALTEHLSSMLQLDSAGEFSNATVDDAMFGAIEAGRVAEMSLQADLIREQAETAGDSPVITASFIEWAEAYEGPKFDVLHVDFPYGKDYAGSNTRMTGRAHIVPTYADSPDIMWELVETLLTWQDALAYEVAHLMFWFDMQYYQALVDSFTNSGWKLVQPHPLIWHKPYQGVASDTRRRPRHTYETALLFSRGDRKLCKLDQDVFVGRTDGDEKLHMNQKPQDMLRHFLRLLVDKNTTVLDPTCGSGSALAASLQLGAPRVLGIESDPENADVARHVVSRDGHYLEIENGAS
jgi:hypothetical protein